MKRRQHSATGISLYTLLAAVVVLGVLGSVLVTQFTGDKTRASAALALMRNTKQAIQRFHLDTGCWPLDLGGLFNQSIADRDNSCGRALSADRWLGAYMRAPGELKTDSNSEPDDYYVREFGPEAAIELQHRPGGAQPYAINLWNIDPKLIALIDSQCGPACQPRNREIYLRVTP